MNKLLAVLSVLVSTSLLGNVVKMKVETDGAISAQTVEGEVAKIPKYEEFVNYNIGGDMTAGILKGVRIGNHVTITLVDADMSGGGGDVKNTASDVIPLRFRPTSTSNWNVCVMSGSFVYLCMVQADGQFAIEKRDWAGALSSVGFNFTDLDVSVSYVTDNN
jgi:hypothetical protein